jgi:iron-sulfur cluster assembly protein
MAIALTDSAKDHVRALKAQPEHQGTWLRVAIRGGGCSGLSYFFDWVNTPEDKDKRFEFGDVQVCIDPKSYLFLNGSTLDFQDNLVKTGFVFENPNATSSCSCGTSFTI